jgi:hypothetical protein
MSADFIKDGTGKGYLAGVDSMNRLETYATTEALFDNRARAGEAFNINTELLSISSTAETPLLYVKNNQQSDIVLVGWFIGTDLGTVGASLGLMRVYGNPIGLSGGSALSALNRRIGDPKVFAIDALSQPTWTPSGTPVLYQTQSLGSRVFGTVNIFVARAQSVVVTCEFATATTPFEIYTGFTGYVEEGE